MKNENIRKWYMEEYPDDELGTELNKNVTFEMVYEFMKKGIDFYDLMGSACDSTIRERIFNQLSIAYDTSYENIYDLWLEN